MKKPIILCSVILMVILLVPVSCAKPPTPVPVFRQDVIEKTIQVNESQTVNGITITLERVELAPFAAMFWAFNIPPDYHLPQDRESPPPHLVLPAEAEYSLDGGPAIKAGPSRFRFYEEGMRHSWKYLDPIPKGTKELTFTITRLGDWEGPWEFHIPIGLTLDEIDIYTDATQTISASIGEEFAIGLHVVLRLGPNWVESHDDNMLALVGDSYYIPDDIANPGLGGNKYFQFKALKAGKTKINVILRHGTTGPVVEQKVFNVEIK